HRWRARAYAPRADDQRCDDRRDDSDGAGHRRRRRGDRAAGPRGHRRTRSSDGCHPRRAAVDLFVGSAVGVGRVAVARSRRPGKRLPRVEESRMTAPASTRGPRGLAALEIACAVLLMACSRESATARTDAAQPAGPPTIEIVRVVQRSVDVTLEMPGELDPYEAVAVFPKVTGFVKDIRVDRGSSVRRGQLMAELEAPELVAQRAEAQSKVQAAQAQLGAARSKADADASTFEKLKAAAATPGVVAGNDVVLAEKNVEADQSQVAAAQKNVDAAREALNAVTQMEGYLRVTAPFDGVVTERNVHPGPLV